MPPKVQDPLAFLPVISLDDSISQRVRHEKLIKDTVSKQSITFEPSRYLNRTRWTPSEIEFLKAGVRHHGVGKWKEILSDSHYTFQKSRISTDLKDKWRNMYHYTKYREHHIRKFILIDENHKPILNASSSPHIYNNRWPRDAAMKVATKSRFYPTLDHTGPIVIYIRELASSETNSPNINTVWVYRGFRRRIQVDPNIFKFSGVQSAWEASVKRIRTEILSYESGALVCSIPDNDTVNECTN